MDFGIPKQRRKKVEFHADQPVVRMLAVTEEGQRSKFVMNTKAAEMLGFGEEGDEKVSISFDGGLYIANTTDTDVEQYNVTKNKPHAFSNTKLRNYMIKHLELDASVDVDFLLERVPSETGMNIASMIHMSTEEVDEVVTINTEVEEIPEVNDVAYTPVVEEVEETNNEW